MSLVLDDLTFSYGRRAILRIAKDEKNLKQKEHSTESVRVVITSRFNSSKTATICFTVD